MNELSTEVKARETHENATVYYSRAEYNLYKHVMEVKKIRDERYYKELGYETFDEYCQSEWNVKRDVMYQRIQIAERLSEDDFVDFNLQFGHNKTLLLTRMTESQREQALEKGIPTNEGYKPYDEATQKEINEYRRNAEEAEQRAIEAERAKQQAESQAEQARRSEEIARKRLEELEDKEPQVIEREVVKEVDKTDYEKIRQLEKQLEKAKQERQKAIEESDRNIESLENYMNSYVKPEQERKSKIVSFTNDLSVGVSNLASNIEKAKQRLDETIANDEQVINSIERSIESLKDYIIMLDEMKGGDVIEIN